MSAATKAVFLSYAREDTDAARRIAEALRSHGVEVWFDQSELRGGDAWDQKIRRQIRDCALFLPIISQHTQERGEGYFRLEWKLAVERTHLMAEGVPFLAPVVIDDTSDAGAIVPAEFLRVQWTRLSGGLPTTQFVEQVKRLLDAPRKPAAAGSARRDEGVASPVGMGRRVPAAAWGVAIVVLVIALGVIWWRQTKPTPNAGAGTRPPTAEKSAAPTADLSAVASPKADDKSVAVLAFADLSEARNGEYFSDGISEELLNVLAKVPGLRVAARTSAFFFKGKNLPISEIAQKLHVAYVVEGSVQREGDNVRITAQLIKAADGYHVWSEHFDRELKNVFALQDEIAGLIAKNLSLKLGATSAASTAPVNPQAFELYLQGRQAWNRRTPEGYARAEELLNRALALDPSFARAHAALADVALVRDQSGGKIGSFAQRGSPELAKIVAQIERALALDPNSAEAHASLGNARWMGWQLEAAARELRTSIALNPNYASAHQWLGRVLMNDGRMDEGLTELKLAAELDPLSARILDNYAWALRLAGNYTESLATAERALAMQPDSAQALTAKGTALLALRRMDEAVAIARRMKSNDTSNVDGGVMILAGAGLKAEAEAVLPLVTDEGWKFFAFAALGRREESAAAFDAQRLSVITLGFFLFEPVCDSMRGDPRVAQALATVGAAEAHARAQAWRATHPPQNVK
jgi:TolB-like protein/tetratricopeptide (TPR) repeat protein